VFEKLRLFEARYEELGRLLGDPAVIASKTEYARLAKARAELEQVAKRFGGKLADANEDAVVIEAAGDTKALDRLVEQLRPHGITKLVRTGRVALEK